MFVLPTPGILTNLHVVLIMDCTNTKFSVNCESNPAFFKKCTVQWLDGWSRESMVKVSERSTVTCPQKLRDESVSLLLRRGLSYHTGLINQA